MKKKEFKKHLYYCYVRWAIFTKTGWWNKNELEEAEDNFFKAISKLNNTKE